MLKLYLPALIIAAIFSGGLTYYVKKLATKFKLADLPNSRKIHTHPIPRLGGVAIVITFLVLALGYNLVSPRLNFGPLLWLFDKKLVGVALGALILLIVGIIDDIRGVSAWKKMFWQVLAAVIVVLFGLSVNYIRLPGGLHLDLNTWIVPIHLFNQTYNFVVWGDLLIIFWIVLMINTLNFLDGLDGLAGGISIIAAITLFFLSLNLGQPAAALLCILFAGSVLGFLPWNFNPARIFMGDSGSMFLGYLLGVLSVISGGKLATAFLVLGIPVLDVAWVALRRLLAGHSPFEADKLHFHHRLLTLGLTQRQTVVVLYLISAAFGVVAVISSTQSKIQAVFWLLGLMVILALILVILKWRKKTIIKKEGNV